MSDVVPRQKTFIRTLSPSGFRTGQYAERLGKRVVRSRECWVVVFPDGVVDHWVVDDPDGQYETYEGVA